MENHSSFRIFNASAGSGKTYTLVKAYLKLLLNSNRKEPHKNILAITFTNKAAGEMKERIIEALKQFSKQDIIGDPSSMFKDLVNELDISDQELHRKSKSLLKQIIYNYASFDVSTIDGFTHKIIKTFAYDLKIPMNFEVELDQEALLQGAVDRLISKAGTKKKLTKTLVDFALEKADEDKSWDISYDFNKIANLLINENDLNEIKRLKDKSMDDFLSFKTSLRIEIRTIENEIQLEASQINDLLKAKGLQFNDFTGAYLPTYFERLSNKNFKVSFGTKWQSALLENKPIYPKRLSSEIMSIIDGIQDRLIQGFASSKHLIIHRKFLNAVYKNITPLSVLSAINNELQDIKKEQNKMLISEFNTIISDQIKGQPAPFIYERLGEKFRHYFIDEFQDTSRMQWENLVPLIDHAISSEQISGEKGTAMLVGDAKQAIYRWRGGVVEQFIDLFSKTSRPFKIEQLVENLPTNFRSHKEIVQFNNTFFDFVSNTVFESESYATLYSQGSKQNSHKTKGGYVQLDFLNLKDEDKDLAYPAKVMETIIKCKEQGFEYNDICVLVRRKKEGQAITEFLNLYSIPVTSSETMLIFYNKDVEFIDSFLRLMLDSENASFKIKILQYLAKRFEIKDEHTYFVEYLNTPWPLCLKAWKKYGVNVDLEQLKKQSLYDMVETVIRAFDLVDDSNAFVQYYLDFVHEYAIKSGSDLNGFLEYSHAKKESLSISIPGSLNAVKIMTIHKSKGLEFKVVIFPYADLEIVKPIDEKVWFPLTPNDFNGFSSALLNLNKDLESFGDIGEALYNKHIAQLQLDNINLLYVALTRPIDHLYIISKGNVSDNDLKDSKSFASLFINFLKLLGLWNESTASYSFGEPITDKQKLDVNARESLKHLRFISTSKESHSIRIITKSGMLWDTSQQEAIEKGNLIHNILASVKTSEDIPFVVSSFIDSGNITYKQGEQLKKQLNDITSHPELRGLYEANNTIYNERDIITKNELILRPDRIVIDPEGRATIIDYKTGEEHKSHHDQMHSYKQVVKDMGYDVIRGILVYINADIKVVSI